MTNSDLSKKIGSELITLARERDRLEQLIASAGNKAPIHWRSKLADINKSISQIESQTKHGSLNSNISKDVRDTFNNIRNTVKDIKLWLFKKGGKILLILLIALIIIAVIHLYLMTIEKHLTLDSEEYAISIVHPFFICSHKYFEFYICAYRKKGIVIKMEIRPTSNELWIKGDNWNKNIDILHISRTDWRPELFFKPNGSFWHNLYSKKYVDVVLQNSQGKEITQKTITLRTIKFYYPLTTIITVFIVALNARRYRIINVSQTLLER